MDLHIHTLLSPCAEVEMIPDLIVRQAESAGLDVIGICDHNAAENAAACVEAASGSTVKVLPGMECETREGVHVVALFDEPQQAEALQATVWDRLPDEENRPDIFGAQMVVTAEGEFVRYNERLLATSADISIESLVNEVRSLGGIAIPAHVDKGYAGMFGVLGVMPEGLNVEIVEISPRLSAKRAKAQYPQIAALACIKSSDAHRLDEVGERWAACWVEGRSVEELRLAALGSGGRRVEEV